jgi:hypothetical protein
VGFTVEGKKAGKSRDNVSLENSRTREKKLVTFARESEKTMPRVHYSVQWMILQKRYCTTKCTFQFRELEVTILLKLTAQFCH